MVFPRSGHPGQLIFVQSIHVEPLKYESFSPMLVDMAAGAMGHGTRIPWCSVRKQKNLPDLTPLSKEMIRTPPLLGSRDISSRLVHPNKYLQGIWKLS